MHFNFRSRVNGIPGSDPTAIAPGEKHLYIWDVVENSGPGPSDGSSIVWLYHSHIHETPETNSGLVGAIIICKGKIFSEFFLAKIFLWLFLGPCSTKAIPKDVDREIILFFSVLDENASPLLPKNIEKFLPHVREKFEI